VKRVTLALAACASIAYGKTPMQRNSTDLACLLLATNVLPRPGSRYRTSRLKVLINITQPCLFRCIGFRQHANLLVFYPMLFSCQTSSLAVPQDRTTWVVEQNKTAQSSKTSTWYLVLSTWIPNLKQVFLLVSSDSDHHNPASSLPLPPLFTSH
jgi:hypothetical protein